MAQRLLSRIEQFLAAVDGVIDFAIGVGRDALGRCDELFRLLMREMSRRGFHDLRRSILGYDMDAHAFGYDIRLDVGGNCIVIPVYRSLGGAFDLGDPDYEY